MSRAKRIVVTESTYSWWAAFLGQAHEVHAPGSGVVPVPYQERHYVFHDINDHRYWGRYNTSAKAVVYEYPDEPDIPKAAKEEKL